MNEIPYTYSLCRALLPIPYGMKNGPRNRTYIYGTIRTNAVCGNVHGHNYMASFGNWKCSWEMMWFYNKNKYDWL